MVEYDERPSKAAAWRDGELVVLPDAALEDCTVWMGVQDDSDRMVNWEGCWPADSARTAPSAPCRFGCVT